MKPLFAATLGLALTVPVGGRAVADPADFQGLNCATTIITGTVDPEKSRGVAETLRQVLVKLTGDEASAADNAMPSSFDPPVEKLELEDRMKDIPVHDEQGTRERPHFLRVCFEREPLLSAIRSAGFKPWLEERPTLEIRLAIETPGGRYILRETGAEGFGQRLALIDTAVERGLPVSLPDQNSDTLDVGDLKSFVFEGPPALTEQDHPVLYGLLTLNPDGADWDATWRLSGEAKNWKADEVSFDEAFRTGLGKAIERLRPQ
ncbi:DUF2066 domain-containing protein [Notoacmeibacter ruber]|uniref:DUF2066 domain-containing protein n=1 Tax=Notoacmeibacter ruber TaxID=2670375 RepID=A0A3L7JDA5_9HYPH|nr:DUF2066 domain-containing protein [Notoacmeibacter ruber]RLQ88444.1 DUF2066 domain-containing protein [Notoacmeibacter ruber]